MRPIGLLLVVITLAACSGPEGEQALMGYGPGLKVFSVSYGACRDTKDFSIDLEKKTFAGRQTVPFVTTQTRNLSCVPSNAYAQYSISTPMALRSDQLSKIQQLIQEEVVLQDFGPSTGYDCENNPAEFTWRPILLTNESIQYSTQQHACKALILKRSDYFTDELEKVFMGLGPEVTSFDF